MGLFDVHAHLTHPDLREDIEVILDRAQATGVTTIISNGLNPSDNEKTLALARACDLVKAAVGLYPVDAVLGEMVAAGVPYPREEAHCSAAEGIAYVREHAQEAFAIGEIGLDGHWVPEAFWPQQEQVFRALVEIALAVDKPIIIHTRKRERRTLDILVEMGARRVNWHCFGSKVKLARQIADAGHYLSIPANARRSESFTRMLQTLPRERILLETDCPYLGPVPGERNEPANVAGTLAFAAELWQVSEREALSQLEQNFEGLFGQRP